MIIDHISNRTFYYGLGEKYREALDYFAALHEGTKPLPEAEKADIPLSEDVIIRVRPMMTKPESECRVESHVRYADIHFVPDGLERIGYVPLNQVELEEARPEEDISFWKGKSELLTLRPGYFMIAFPQDGHLPTVCGDRPSFLLKLIAKIRL